MRIDDSGDESNIEDRRGVGGGGGGGGAMSLGGGGMRLGLGGFIIVGLLSLVFRTNLFSMFGGGSPSSGGGPAVAGHTGQATQRDKASEEQAKKIAEFAFNDSQKFWAQETTQKEHAEYRPAKMVLFWDETRSGCGEADAQTGPFYCPADGKVYLDLGFFHELDTRFGAPGDFAQAYVVAHEMGHHVQDVLGIEHKMRQAQARSPGQKNDLSVRLELQADCLAGVWGHSTNDRHILEPGDADEGLRAAASIGDDKLQKQATGRVRPETFTHGTSEQRKTWLMRGLKSGKLEDCDTFAATSL